MSTKSKKKSWKTTTCGVMAFLIVAFTGAIALLDGDPETVIDMKAVGGGIAALLTLFGLSFARDNDVSSEDAGAKDPE